MKHPVRAPDAGSGVRPGSRSGSGQGRPRAAGHRRGGITPLGGLPRPHRPGIVTTDPASWRVSEGEAGMTTTADSTDTAPGRRLRGLRDHRRPRPGDDVPVAVPAGGPRPPRLPDRRRRGRRLDHRPARSSGPAPRSRGPGETIDEEVFKRFADRLSYVGGDFTDPATYGRVGEAIKGAETPVFYLEIPPFLFGKVVEGHRRRRPEQRARASSSRSRSATTSSPRAPWPTSCTSTSTSRSCSGSTTTSGRWASRRSCTCASPTRSSSRSGAATTSTASRSRWPRTSASTTAAASTTRSARCATSWSTT